MPSNRAPAAKKTTTLTVAVKCRPLMEKERGRDIVRVNNSKEVIVLDPDLSKDYLDRIQNRTKEKKYCFDHAFGPESTNKVLIPRNFGKILNVRKASEAKIRKNKVVQDIIKILKLDREMEYTDSRSLRYGQVMIMTDQDDDGIHMTGLLINLFSTLSPSLLKVPSFLVEFITPIVKDLYSCGKGGGFLTEEVGDKGECIYTTYGKCHDDIGGTVQISELPIGLWTDDCKRFLLSLKATNGDPFIQDVNVYNDGSSVSLNLRLSEENKQAARQEGYEKKFKLETKIATTNMNLVIDEDQIKNYHTPEEIIEDFFPQRIDFYRKRRDHMEKSVKNEVT